MSRRVLYVNQNFVTARQAGNSRPVHTLAAILARGFKVDVVTGRVGYLDDAAPSAPPPVVQREGDLSLHRVAAGRGPSRLANRGASYIRFLAAAGRYLPRIPRPDVIYATSPPLPQLLLSVAASARYDAPLVLEVRDLWPAYLVEAGLLRSAALIRAMEWIESLAYHCADHCIVLAPAFVEHLAAMGVSRERISVVPTGGDPALVRAGAAERRRWRASHGLGGKFVLLYAGSFNEYYGLSLAADAARALAATRDDVHWAFAGNGRDRPIIEAAAARCPTVHYLGAVPKDDLLAALLSADAGLVSGVPRPIMELTMHGKLFDYLAAALPVISTIDGQSGQTIRAARAGTVLETPTADRLARAVADLADMPAEKRRRTGARGREWVMRFANSTAMAEKVADIIAPAERGRGHGSRLARLAGAAARACRDAARGASAKAVEAHFGQGRAEAIERAFRQWSEQAAEAAEAAPQGPPRRKVPSLLSAWDR